MYVLSLLFLGIFCLGPLFAELSVSIDIHNEDLYFVDAPIDLAVTIENSGIQDRTFSIADEFMQSIDMEVWNEQGEALGPSATFIRARNRQHMRYRNLTLLPTEQFVRIIRLNEFVDLVEPGIYTIRAHFYENLPQDSFDRQTRTIHSNSLLLSIRPGTYTENRIDESIRSLTEEVLIREDLRPDEIVEYVVQARRNSDWERFFLFIDVESLLLETPDLKQRYMRASGEAKQDMLALFRETLKEERIEDSITAVPSDVRILKTEYGPLDGTVLTQQVFNQSTFEVVKEYLYYFERKNYWKITGYSVLNLGTRAISVQ